MEKTDQRINEALAREFERQEAREANQKSGRSSNSKGEDLDDLLVLRPAQDLQFECHENAASPIDKQLMAWVIKENCICHVDVDEIYSPPRVVPEAG